MDVIDLIDRGARAHRGRTALVDGEDGRTWSFGQVAERSARLANALATLGSPGDRVALLLPNRPEFVESDLAIARAGMVKVPINPRLADEEREHVLRDSGASVLIADAAGCAFADAAGDRLPLPLRVIAVDDPGTAAEIPYEALLRRASPRAPDLRVGMDAPSVILYTSGTTGRAKGATWTVRSRVAGTMAMLVDELDAGPRDVMVHAAPLSHGSGSKILAYWTRGAANLVVRKFDPERFLALVAEGRATASFMVPTMVAMLVEAHERIRGEISGLRTISYGGAPIAPERLAHAVATLGPVLVQVYGTSEAPHPLTVLTKSDHVAGGARLGSTGREVLGVDVRIVARDGSDVPEGPGELWVRAGQVMRGYWGNDEATAQVLVDGWYRTGDVGRTDEDGFLYLIDRERDVVISGGLNVYPAEVEAALLRHPAVAEAAVVGIPDPKWGEAVAAFVVRAPGASVTADDLLDHCRALLAGYKKPRRIELVPSLPRGSTGKILKRALRDPYWRGEARQVH